ncbi:putative ribonuclease H-like domain-containing protein [Tanacetum coccineum]
MELCIAFKKLMHEKFQMSSMGEHTFFLGLQVKQKRNAIFISQDKYVDEIFNKFGFTKVKTASTPIEIQKPLLNDEDGKEVDVHISRCKKQTVVANSTTEAEYVAASSCYGQVLWIQNQLLEYGTINGKSQLHAPVDGKKIIITESSIRRDLQLADEEGVDSLLNSTIFEQLTLMGPKTTAWNEFSSTMTSAIICLAILTDPHHTPTFIQPSTQPQKTQQPRKPKRKDTQVPQPSDPIENVADEVVHKELGDSLVRATTTASSLKAEQDSGGGPRGNTLRSDEDRLKLDKLMALCTTLQNRVLDLEKTKTTQHNEIASLKRKVKKIEKKNRSRTYKLKRLYKVSLTARVESSGDEESLVVVKDVNNEVNVVEEVVEVINSAKLITDVAQVSVAGNVVSIAGDATTVSAATTTTATITIVDDITLAQALMEIKSIKPKEKGVVIQELGEFTTTISSQLSSQQSQDKGKGILIELVKPMKKKKDLIRLDEEAALKLQAEFLTPPNL